MYKIICQNTLEDLKYPSDDDNMSMMDNSVSEK